MRITEGQLRRIIRKELNSLNESELRWSQTTLQSIKKIVTDNWEKRGVIEVVEIPLEEIYYLDNPKIKNGAAIIDFLHNKHMGVEEIPEFVERHRIWDSKKRTFDISKLSPFRIAVMVSDLPGGNYGQFEIDGSGEWFMISLDPTSIGDVDALVTTVKHELQHLTQSLNTLALSYGKQVEFSRGDLSKIAKIDLSSLDSKDVGLPSKRTGLTYITPEEARALGVSEEERLERYHGSDTEYETWVTGLVDAFAKWIVWESEPLSLIAAALRDVVNSKGLPASMSQIRAIANKNRVSVERLVKEVRKASGINKMVVEMVDQLLKNDPSIKLFHERTGHQFVAVITTNKKHRLREFTGDLITRLEESLREQMERWMSS